LEEQADSRLHISFDRFRCRGGGGWAGQ
jgi:hypothetical protein